MPARPALIFKNIIVKKTESDRTTRSACYRKGVVIHLRVRKVNFFQHLAGPVAGTDATPFSSYQENRYDRIFFKQKMIVEFIVQPFFKIDTIRQPLIDLLVKRCILYFANA
jgi:hypothetical protein